MPRGASNNSCSHNKQENSENSRDPSSSTGRQPNEEKCHYKVCQRKLNGADTLNNWRVAGSLPKKFIYRPTSSKHVRPSDVTLLGLCVFDYRIKLVWIIVSH
jgi:hypothetical protein